MDILIIKHHPYISQHKDKKVHDVSSDFYLTCVIIKRLIRGWMNSYLYKQNNEVMICQKGA